MIYKIIYKNEYSKTRTDLAKEFDLSFIIDKIIHEYKGTIISVSEYSSGENEEIEKLKEDCAYWKMKYRDLVDLKEEEK